MCRYVDGRVWPSSDKTDVLLFLSLMLHVTGQSASILRLPVFHFPCLYAHAASEDSIWVDTQSHSMLQDLLIAVQTNLNSESDVATSVASLQAAHQVHLCACEDGKQAFG